MYECPHCYVESVTTWEKANSSSTFPKRCRKCGERYYISGWGLASVAMSFEVLLWSAIIIALMIKSWFGLLVFPVGIGLSYFVLVKVTELKPITDEEVRKSRIISILVIGGIIVIVSVMEKFG